MKTKMFMAAFAAMCAMAVCSCGNKKAAVNAEANDSCCAAKMEACCGDSVKACCGDSVQACCGDSAKACCKGEKACEGACEKK